MNKKVVLPSNKKFGLFFSLIFLIIFFYLFYLTYKYSYLALVISIILTLISILKPNILEKPNYMWFKLGIILGKIFSPIILGFIFFAIITPVALIMKIIRRDVLKINIKKQSTYWEKYENEKTNMKNQY